MILLFLVQMSLGGFEITPPVTFRLQSGSGPVHISGQHFISEYLGCRFTSFKRSTLLLHTKSAGSSRLAPRSSGVKLALFYKPAKHKVSILGWTWFASLQLSKTNELCHFSNRKSISTLFYLFIFFTVKLITFRLYSIPFSVSNNVCVRSKLYRWTWTLITSSQCLLCRREGFWGWRGGEQQLPGEAARGPRFGEEAPVGSYLGAFI